MKNSRKILTCAAAAVGLAAMLAAPISQAGWRYRHHWHPAGRMIQFRGCRKIVTQRFCRVNRFDEGRCFVQRRVRFVC
ncbi:MAG: hypothetical protein K0U29_05310 [Gammaproteobacteria bacterium]|nr:hypothetical protein [Gammaproteobacteria bacterium]MCH9744335.1 hypothetical protein [Gammaproteobacteria bacterium]